MCVFKTNMLFVNKSEILESVISYIKKGLDHLVTLVPAISRAKEQQASYVRARTQNYYLN